MAGYRPQTRKDVVKVILKGVPDRPGMAAGIFGSLGEKGINVELITASTVGEGRSDVSFVIHQMDLERTLEQAANLKEEFNAEGLIHDKNVALVALHVAELVQTPGTAGRMFGALSGRGINIDMISTSMATITCVIPENLVDEAVKALEEEFDMG